MILYLIRHGKPDYNTDTLLPEGREQAELVARRLERSGIDEIHSSPMERALETAAPLAKKLSMPVIVEPWAREVGPSAMTLYPWGRPVNVPHIPPALVNTPSSREIGFSKQFTDVPGLSDGGYEKKYLELAAGVDGMLAKLGYERTPEGFYNPVAPSSRHVALFCHVAMMRMTLGHLLNIPMQFIGATLMTHFTGVTILEFDAQPREGGVPCQPYLIAYGDVGHLHLAGGPIKMYMSGHEF